jgi:hypothetical protein
MHLGPVEAHDLAVGLGEEEAGRVEPVFGLAVGDVLDGPAGLVGVVGEGGVVDLEPRRLVLPGHERPDCDVVRPFRLLQGR